MSLQSATPNRLSEGTSRISRWRASRVCAHAYRQLRTVSRRKWGALRRSAACTGTGRSARAILIDLEERLLETVLYVHIFAHWDEPDHRRAPSKLSLLHVAGLAMVLSGRSAAGLRRACSGSSARSASRVARHVHRPRVLPTAADALPREPVPLYVPVPGPLVPTWHSVLPALSASSWPQQPPAGCIRRFTSCGW